MNYLINSEEANEILLGERGVPASTKIAEHINKLVSETEQKSFAYVTDVITPNCSPINPPDPTGMSELNDTLKKIVEKVSYGESMLRIQNGPGKETRGIQAVNYINF